VPEAVHRPRALSAAGWESSIASVQAELPGCDPSAGDRIVPLAAVPEGLDNLYEHRWNTAGRVKGINHG
jgi:hypothetical protein